ncbi:DUF4926 domain-containing protein [Cnuella takakiae]|nr:DUF4926 domain-containing protein [Cnuella takakiae]OLY94605.1 hypothetical protein BUE76_02225 [Cnuella takakiae]
MIKALERVYLLEDLTGTAFVKGDVGTVVAVYPNQKGYEVEFFALDGTSLGVETVLAHQVQSANGIKKVLHIDIAA